jgi:hypothetical protein
LVGCLGAGKDIIRRNFVQGVQKSALAGKNTGPGKIDLWGRFRPSLVQSIVFFVCHIRHSLLLYAHHFPELLSAFHRMKNLYCLVVNMVIHYFKQIAGPVKADRNILGFIVFFNDSIGKMV